jgi:hypothetical protein
MAPNGAGGNKLTSAGSSGGGGAGGGAGGGGATTLATTISSPAAPPLGAHGSAQAWSTYEGTIISFCTVNFCRYRDSRLSK